MKGPGDNLSNKQIVWLSRLIQWGHDAEVCRVKGSLVILITFFWCFVAIRSWKSIFENINFLIMGGAN